MKDFFADPFAQKIIATLLGAGLLMVAHFAPEFSEVLAFTAGGLGVGTYAYHATPPSAKKDEPAS